jgi:hypothetical protein
LQPVPVTLAGGERLAFGVSVDEGLLLRKPDDYKIGVPAARASSLKSAPDYCAYQTFQLNAAGQMTLVLVLDAVGSGPVKRSFVHRPDEIEFDVVPAGSLKRLSSTMRLKPDMTVPAWELVYDDWPAGQPAEVRAWWKMERTLPDLLLSWSDISAAYNPEQARSIQLGDQMPELQLMARRPTETQLQIALSSLAAGQLSEDMAQALDGIRVELGQVDVRGRFQPYELSFTRDFSVADGSLIVEFDLTNKLDLDRSTVALTTLNSRRQSAVQLKKPLTVSRFDSIGVTSQPP